MKLKILGTGTSQGVPIIGCNCEVCTSSDPKDKRLRTAAQITSETSRILIDIGPDFRQQMLAMKSASAIDGILITHEHSDHTTGIDDIRPFNKFSPHSIPIFAEDPVIKDLKLRYRYIFSDHPYPGGPRLELMPVDVDQRFTVGDIVVKTFRVWHGTLGILGFQFDKCAYITDASRLDEGVIDSLKGISVCSSLSASSHTFFCRRMSAYNPTDTTCKSSHSPYQPPDGSTSISESNFAQWHRIGLGRDGN